MHAPEPTHSTAEAARAAWPRRAALFLAGMVLMLVLLDEAWVGEDSLITFRSIEHWVNGYGLRFNIDERVQSFTHPLWMLLNAALFALTHKVFWPVTVLGLVCSLGAWSTLVWRHRRRPAVAIGCITVPWLACACLRRWSTSGLENSLSFLLLAGFFGVLMSWRGKRDPPWGWLSLLAALAATNRLDNSLFVAPALVWLLLRERRRTPIGRILLGLSPLIGWLGFSLFYFGFLVPNTGPAKLSSGFPTSAYVHAGALYLLDLFQHDLPAAMLLIGGLAVGAHAAWRWLSGRSTGQGGMSDRALAMIAAGILLYVLYVVRIGGGFLSGRFLAAPVLMSIAVIAERASALGTALWQQPWGRRVGLAVALAVGLVAALVGAWQVGQATLPLTLHTRILALPIARVELSRKGQWVLSKWAVTFRQRGHAARRRAAAGQHVTPQHALGFTGMAAGPDAILIDRFGLTDPLLARLPPEDSATFRAGHARRLLPRGYQQARETGSLLGMDSDLAAYYARLRLVVSGPLFSRERLATIAAFTLGRVQPPDPAERTHED